jgi:DNA-binding CsgD family transcriptional regulator
MFNSGIANKLQSVSNLKELKNCLDTIECMYPQFKCALLLPKNSYQSRREEWLGSVSREISAWIDSNDVKKQLESDFALLPLFYHSEKDNRRQGVVISTSTPSYLAVWFVIEAIVAEVEDEDVIGAIAIGRFIADAFHRIMTEQSQLLTDRERECMKWVAEGKTSWEVGQILGVSERTVNFHIQNCIDKTDSVNRSQAITKCITGALIKVSH